MTISRIVQLECLRSGQHATVTRPHEMDDGFGWASLDILLARPRLRPARSKGTMIGLGAALTGQSGLARILEKQNGPTMNPRLRKKLDSSATSFAFQGFWNLSQVRKTELPIWGLALPSQRREAVRLQAALFG